MPKKLVTQSKTIKIHETINLNNFRIPDKIDFFNPLDNAEFSYGEKDKLPELVKYDTLDKWKTRLEKGKFYSINDPYIGGIKNIDDGYTDIRQCMGWKLVRIESELINSKIACPVVAKRKDGTVTFIDGRTTACLLNEFDNKDLRVWCIDTLDDEEDLPTKVIAEDDNMQPVFDYGNIKPEHQALVRDIIKRIENDDHNIDLKNELSVLFKLEDENEFDLDTSIFIKYANKINLHVTKQGHITVKDGDKKPINYPIVSVCDDIRRLDELVETIMKDVMLKAREIQNNGTK